jgi:hypothetical protein
LSYRERGDHRTGRVRDAADTASAQRIRLVRGYRNISAAFVTIGGVNGRSMGRKRFLNPVRLRCNAAAGSSQSAGIWPNFADLS